MSPGSGTPFFHHSSAGRPNSEAFERWRSLMAPTYDVGPVAGARHLPSGEAVVYRIGPILAHRMVFGTQQVRRDAKRMAAAADNITIQFWRRGGFRGEIGGRGAEAGPGTALFIASRDAVQGIAEHNDACGIVVPRAVFHGLPVESRGLRLDPDRNRLLVARIGALYRQAQHGPGERADGLAAEIMAFLRRLVDPSTARDALDGRELDGGLRALAQSVIRANLTRPDLTPETIAAALRISRATLYRVFAPEDGVMQVVHRERLLAVRDALNDPFEARSLARLADAYGIGSPSQLSRGFRRQFGMVPKAWRAQRLEARANAAETDAGLLWSWLRP